MRDRVAVRARCASAISLSSSELRPSVPNALNSLETAATVLSESLPYNAAKHGHTVVHTDESTQMAFTLPGGGDRFSWWRVHLSDHRAGSADSTPGSRRATRPSLT